MDIEYLKHLSLKVSNLKCFGGDEQGFDAIQPINLIIGRNNSGKSTLLDLISYVVSEEKKIPKTQWHDGKSEVAPPI